MAKFRVRPRRVSLRAFGDLLTDWQVWISVTGLPSGNSALGFFGGQTIFPVDEGKVDLIAGFSFLTAVLSAASKLKPFCRCRFRSFTDSQPPIGGSPKPPAGENFLGVILRSENLRNWVGNFLNHLVIRQSLLIHNARQTGRPLINVGAQTTFA